MKTKFCSRACLWLAFCLFAGSIGILGASAAPPEGVPTPVLLDGAEVLPGECTRIGGTTYVPLRRFCALFGVTDLSWNARTSTATASAKNLSLTARTGDLYITANGHIFYTVSPVRNLAGSLYVPVRPLARAFALDLDWDAANAAVLLRRTDRGAVAWARYDADQLYWLSRVISAEARGEPLQGQIAVGNVVLNRVASREFPNSIWAVIFDRKYGVQFSPVLDGSIYATPTASAVLAAKICLEGDTVSDRALYFMNPKTATSTWIGRSRPYLFTVGNHAFYA